MAATESRRVKLDYPLQRVQEPVIYRLVVDYHLVPNIRRAEIDVRTGGWIVLEVQGAPDDLEAGIDFLRQQGITVTDVDTGQSWNV